MRIHRLCIPLLASLLMSACADRGAAAGSAGEVQGEGSDTDAPLVETPFVIDESAEGLLFVYFDEEGTHSVERLPDVPEAHREYVRVDSLGLAPEERLAPGFVYVADLRAPSEGGGYAARRMSREAFDGLVDRAGGYEEPTSPEGRAAGGEGGVIVYGASWCGACNSTEAFLRGAGVPFVERDIERDPGAREEMVAKMTAAGRRPGGIPVIDFRGTIVEGFDRPTLERLIGQTDPI